MSQLSAAHDQHPIKASYSLALAALGVVFGDIGTSPLYTIRECFHGPHAVAITPGNIMGVLSLVFWSLAIVVSLKYVLFILRADSKGEGGIFALMALLPSRDKGLSGRRRKAVILACIFGAALLYGDGIITPSISVLSAIEGLEMATPKATPFVVPMTCLVLIFLFSFQSRGTAKVGRVFGPIMLLWFLTIAALGIGSIVKVPEVLLAINPYHAWRFFAENHLHGIVVLGSVVLCITGGEALYADLGHFDKKSIRMSWAGLVWPA
ncbi:MAG: KUP/HAK/KT family potassium transporter, partial [Deltaproteobacteria bacterium]|nr:KUP/HAK/KT family potassium transporter [Deltaproteobacteria bacterium]